VFANTTEETHRRTRAANKNTFSDKAAGETEMLVITQTGTSRTFQSMAPQELTPPPEGSTKSLILVAADFKRFGANLHTQSRRKNQSS
jgi:hypothetical protein